MQRHGTLTRNGWYKAFQSLVSLKELFWDMFLGILIGDTPEWLCGKISTGNAAFHSTHDKLILSLRQKCVFGCNLQNIFAHGAFFFCFWPWTLFSVMILEPDIPWNTYWENLGSSIRGDRKPSWGESWQLIRGGPGMLRNSGLFPLAVRNHWIILSYWVRLNLNF